MRDYRRIVYAPREVKRPTRWPIYVILVASLIFAFHLDDLAVRECNGNEDCIAAVLP